VQNGGAEADGTGEKNREKKNDKELPRSNSGKNQPEKRGPRPNKKMADGGFSRERLFKAMADIKGVLTNNAGGKEPGRNAKN